MIAYIPLRNPITKAVLGSFYGFVAFMALVQDKPWIGLLFFSLSAFTFWAAAQQWKAANAGK